MGVTFSSNQLAGFASNGLPATSYAYSTGNKAYLGGDITYANDGPIFIGPVGEVTPFLVQPAAAAPTLTCSPITVDASSQSLECPVAGTALTGGLYTLSFLQYTSAPVTNSDGSISTDASGNTVYTKVETTSNLETDSAGNLVTDSNGNYVYTTASDTDNTLTAWDDGYTYSFIAPVQVAAATTVTEYTTPYQTGYATITSGVSEILPSATINVPASVVTVTVYATTVVSHKSSKTTLLGYSTTITKTGACPKSTLLKCNQDNCYRAMSNRMESASSFCAGYTTTTNLPTPSYLTQCSGLTSRVSSACTCLFSPTAKAIPARGAVQVVYAAPDFTYSDSAAGAAVTVTDTAAPTTTIVYDVPSATVVDPAVTLSSGTSTITSGKASTVTVTVFTSTVDKRSATTVTVSPSFC